MNSATVKMMRERIYDSHPIVRIVVRICENRIPSRMLPVRANRTAPRIPKRATMIKRLNTTRKRRSKRIRRAIFEAAAMAENLRTTTMAIPATSTMARGRIQRIHTIASLIPSIKRSVQPVKSGAGLVPRYIRTT